MKKILLVFLLLPLISQAQKFELSAQAGNMFTYDGKKVYRGLSDQATISYHVANHFAISAFYERNSWFTKEHSFGMSPEYAIGHFFTGIDLKIMHFNNQGSSEYGTQYRNSFGYGAHAGLKQNLSKHLSLIEQAGYSGTVLVGTDVNYLYGTIDNYGYVIGPGGVYQFVQNKENKTFNSPLNYGYLRVGLSYKF